MRHLLYRRCSRTPRPGIWKQHLDQNHAKLINNINIRLLINMCSPKRFLIMLIRIMFFFTKKSIVQSCPICSITRYTNQLSSRAWRRRSPLTGAFQFVFNQGQAQLAAWRDPKKRTNISFLQFYINMLQIHVVSTASKPQTHGLFYCWGPRPPFQSSSLFKVNSQIVLNFILE